MKLSTNQEPCGCEIVGPLLTAPGTSGRPWKCGTCGTVYEHEQKSEQPSRV